METRFYTERSNARRAARSAGIDPDSVYETPDGFTFKTNEATDMPPANGTDLSIPNSLKFSAEERKEGWSQNPPKAQPIKDTTMAKPKKAAAAKKEKKASGGDKTETMLAMLKGKGATVDALCKSTGWLPHTLRARISNVCKAKKDGGMGLKIERERVEGVTTYRLAA